MKHYNLLPPAIAPLRCDKCRDRAQPTALQCGDADLEVFREAWPIRDRQAAHDGEDPAGWTVPHRSRGGASLACLPPHLPAPPASGRLIVLAAGKAAGAMTEVAEQHYLDRGKLPPDRLDRACRDAPRLWPPEPQDRDGRSRPSGARCGGARGGAEDAAARRRGGRGRSRAGAVLGRRLGELDRAGGRVDASPTSRR